MKVMTTTFVKPYNVILGCREKQMNLQIDGIPEITIIAIALLTRKPDEFVVNYVHDVSVGV